jgi:type I restriction enzyme S subunit
VSWPVVALKTVCDIQMGSAPKGETYVDLENGIPLVAGAADYGEIYPAPKKSTTEPTKLCKKGDLIICVRATIGDLNWADNVYCLGRGVAGLRVKPELSSKYLFYFIKAHEYVLYRNSTGSTFPQINRKVIEQLEIPLPPLPVQKQIAAVLEKADTLRSQCQQMEQELNSLAQSLFLYTVGDMNSDFLNWPLHSIESLCSSEKGSMRTGPFGSDLKHSEFVESGYPVIGIDNAVENEFKWKERRFITEEKYQKLKRYTVKPKDIIITIMGTVGRVAVIPDNIPTSISTKHLAVLTINNEIALPEFVADAFRYSTLVNHQISKKNKGAIMDGLNLGIIKSLNVRLPPIQLQNKYLSRKEKLISSLSICRSEADELTGSFNSLMQRAFKGELALKDVA